MKNKFFFKRLAVTMAVAGLGASTLASCSAPKPAEPPATPEPTPVAKMDSAKSNDTEKQPKTYHNVRGQVASLAEPKAPGEPVTIVLDHEEIPDFMKAMQMTMPLKDAGDYKKLKKGDKISCDFVLENGTFYVANVQVLPADTKLKLAPA